MQLEEADERAGLPIHFAWFQGHGEIVQELISHFKRNNLPENYSKLFEAEDADGATLIHRFSMSGDYVTLKSILPFVHNINKTDKRGITPLLVALVRVQPDAMLQLLAHGAQIPLDADIPEEFGQRTDTGRSQEYYTRQMQRTMALYTFRKDIPKIYQKTLDLILPKLAEEFSLNVFKGRERKLINIKNAIPLLAESFMKLIESFYFKKTPPGLGLDLKEYQEQKILFLEDMKIFVGEILHYHAIIKHECQFNIRDMMWLATLIHSKVFDKLPNGSIFPDDAIYKIRDFLGYKIIPREWNLGEEAALNLKEYGENYLEPINQPCLENCLLWYRDAQRVREWKQNHAGDPNAFALTLYQPRGNQSPAV